MRSSFFAFVLALGFATAAAAQDCPAVPTGVEANATKLCLHASPDHDAIDLDVPVVSGYSVGYCVAGSNPATCTPVQEQSLGKPNYTGPNKIIQVDTTTLPTLFAVPVGQQFFAVVTVNGSAAGLSARYQPSNFFGRRAGTAPRADAVPPVATH
jgi:hypothetical protein